MKSNYSYNISIYKCTDDGGDDEPPYNHILETENCLGVDDEMHESHLFHQFELVTYQKSWYSLYQRDQSQTDIDVKPSVKMEHMKGKVCLIPLEDDQGINDAIARATENGVAALFIIKQLSSMEDNDTFFSIPIFRLPIEIVNTVRKWESSAVTMQQVYGNNYMNIDTHMVSEDVTRYDEDGTEDTPLDYSVKKLHVQEEQLKNKDEFPFLPPTSVLKDEILSVIRVLENDTPTTNKDGADEESINHKMVDEESIMHHMDIVDEANSSQCKSACLVNEFSRYQNDEKYENSKIDSSSFANESPMVAPDSFLSQQSNKEIFTSVDSCTLGGIPCQRVTSGKNYIDNNEQNQCTKTASHTENQISLEDDWNSQGKNVLGKFHRNNLSLSSSLEWQIIGDNNPNCNSDSMSIDDEHCTDSKLKECFSIADKSQENSTHTKEDVSNYFLTKEKNSGNMNSSKEGKGQGDAESIIMYVEEGNNDSRKESDEDFDFDSDCSEDGKEVIVDILISKPFNMDILIQSIENGSRSLEMVNGKDVVLIVGKTGTGKSTLIQGIAGKIIRSAVYTASYYGEDVEKDVFEAEDALPGFDIGHMKTSKTKCINCYSRPSGLVQGDKNSDNILYLDSPGFEDTDGHEIDIATSAMLSQVAKRCRSLRFIILIKYGSLLEDRGGSIRAVLKFTRTFVQDFGKEKKSFMFLFTHTNEIKDMPESIDSAKAHLSEEIIRTSEGTKDADTLSVLHFMKKSLKKNFPFVDILHPLKTDFMVLSNFIENRLSPVKDPFLAGNCGLTMSSQLKLNGEINTLVLKLRKLLQQFPPDISKINDIRQNFHYLGKYINFGDVKRVVSESEDILDEYIRHLLRSINEEIQRGTCDGHGFSSENARLLHHKIWVLKELNNDASVDKFTKLIENSVASLQNSLLLRRGASFHGVSQKLHKLRSWSAGSSSASALYSNACNHLSSLIKLVIADVSEFQVATIEGKPSSQVKEELCRHIHDLCTLQLLHENSEEFFVHNLRVHEHGVKRVQQAAIQNVLNFLCRWIEESSFTTEANTFDENDQIIVLSLRVRFIETLRDILMQRHFTSHNLLKTVETSYDILETKVFSIFREVFKSIKSTGVSALPRDLHQRLSRIKEVSNLFHDMSGSRWREVQSGYASAVSCIGSALKTRSEELERMLRLIIEEGLTNGYHYGKEFAAFSEYKWFDRFLLPTDRFVENSCIKLKKGCISRFDHIKEKIESCFNAIFGKRFCDSAKELRKLKEIFPELCQFDKFAQFINDGNISAFYSVARKNLETYVGKINQVAQSCLEKWKSAAKDGQDYKKANRLATRLNAILSEIKIINEIDSEKKNYDRIAPIQSLIDCAFEDFSQKVEHVMNSQGCYRIKADYLTLVKELGEVNCTHPLLPKMAKLKEKAKGDVSNTASKIESLVGETSQWDQIDYLLNFFQEAKILDEFTSNEASIRIRYLENLREKKEKTVDSEVIKMIEEQNFKGIGQYLAPLAESKEQVNRQKFGNYRRIICKSLKARIHETETYLASDVSENVTEMIVQNIEVLDDAQHEIGKHLRADLKLIPEIASLKSSVNAKQNMLLTHMLEGIEKLNFVTITANRKLVNKFFRYSQKYIEEKVKKRRLAILERYKKTKESIQEMIDDFFKSKFKDDTGLVQVLSSLKKASEKDKKDSELYQHNINSLEERLKKGLRTTKKAVMDDHCYDDAISLLHCLNRQIDSGLKDLIQKEIVNDIRSNLDHWREERVKMNNEIDFEGKDPGKKFKMLAKNLDRLQANAPFWRGLFGTSYGKTYTNKCEILRKQIAKRFSQGKLALKARDLPLLQECIKILQLMEEAFGSHIKQAKGRLDDLQKESVSAFLRLCEHSREILGSNNESQFEGLFADFRSFVLDVPCVIKSRKCQKEYSLINQLVFETLNNGISQFIEMIKLESGSFDFSEIKTKVEHIRMFGSFVADRFALLYEEEGRCEHVVEGDRWLHKIWELCHQYFSSNHDLKNIRYYAILGIAPSSSKSEIKKAYHEKAKKFHPDKRDIDYSQTEDISAAFRSVKEAWDELEKSIQPTESGQSEPFDNLLRSIAGVLRTKTREYLVEQRYEIVDTLLFQLPGLRELDNLTNPKLNSQQIQGEIRKLVKDHVEKIRVEVKSNWSERKYTILNDSITDLKLMEKHFKAYPDIFPTSWNTGIVGIIENEIEELSRKAHKYLIDKKSAKEGQDEFRSYFIRMGFVMVELPTFKDFTKERMCSVLESCLDSGWGYSYLFDLGLSLQRGDEDCSEEENRIGQVLISEFSYFKEVMTMVWNEETSQKPAENTVRGIKALQCTASGPKYSDSLDVDSDTLLESFNAFESKYKSLLGEYINPEADLNCLVQKTMAVANKLKPLKCGEGWGPEVKQALPSVLAGIFALFTVIKSGASYNRIESSTGTSCNGEELLMKPHNIQVLTLLYMLGCGNSLSSSLESQLMQIRTGEGKSMILGAGAAALGLLGFRVRCVCYSEYLSNRDFNLFEEVFDRFNLLDRVKYSKITSLSEDTTAAKGDIRKLTESLIHGRLLNDNTTDATAVNNVIENNTSTSKNTPKQKGNIVATPSASYDQIEEILLVDEVDVFFGSEFYGQTYNQVSQLREPEVAEILKLIWEANKRGGRRQRLADIKGTTVYRRLLNKVPGFEFLLENEISLMLDQVRRVEEEPYFLDQYSDRIGYKVMDSISFKATYGYRTIFAYLKESDKGNLKNNDETLQKVLTMHISCGQFSYANINPNRILGVSGTLEVMGQFEKEVLYKYGIDKFIFVPSVYGKSNFQFDKAGEGICIESSISDFFHKISEEITKNAKKKRSVIVFFRNNIRMKEFTTSAYYHKLGRQKAMLTEDMNAPDREFVINKAATAGQITICSAVFGRGTDFFCKEKRVLNNGGVHIIQTFLSVEQSEEVQVQGRTARQGKNGSYQMILLESDLERFGILDSEKERVARSDWYDWLCRARDKTRSDYCQKIESNLRVATEKDRNTHDYFDSLLALNTENSSKQFKEIYLAMKKRPTPTEMDLDLSFLIDTTGSMAPFSRAALATVTSLIKGNKSIATKLKVKFPEMNFKVRVASMGFRDIDDQSNQFQESCWGNNSHFSEDKEDSISFIENITKNSSGGFDLAEDSMGAVHRCSNWSGSDDWSAKIKLIILMTDSPAHGFVPSILSKITNIDSYSIRHPLGLTINNVISDLLSKEIDLIFCSFNPAATSRTEEELAQQYEDHPNNKEKREITFIPMAPKQDLKCVDLAAYNAKHIVFVLDESGSMRNDWSGVVMAYQKYISCRMQSQNASDLVSVVQFSGAARITIQQQSISTVSTTLDFGSGGTQFYPAAMTASTLVRDTPTSHTPVVVFMSDGGTNDASQAAQTFSTLNQIILDLLGHTLELHVIAFGSGADTRQLASISRASPAGKLHSSANTAQLSTIFLDIASGNNIAGLIEAEIGKRISDVVTDKLSLEYMA